MTKSSSKKTNETIENMPEHERAEALERQMRVIEEGHGVEGEYDEEHDQKK